MKVSDAVAIWLRDHGIKHVFTISGGADLHIIDSIAKTEGITYVCPQNEQCASFAADAYARLNGMGCALVTSGPGATNLVTGIAASYYDSVPVLYLTGNQTVELMDTHGTRQLGFQATPIVDIVEPITKYATTVVRPQDVIPELDKALAIAKSGRPGPVLIDLPDDIQRAEIIEADARRAWAPLVDTFEHADLSDFAREVLGELLRARQPVIAVGWGVALSGGADTLLRVLEALDIPVVATWGGMEVVGWHRACLGGFGTHGARAANFAVQQADYLLTIGTRLDTKAMGSPASSFAPAAKLVMVDRDSAEIHKMQRLGRSLHRSMPADARQFCDYLGAWAREYNDLNYASNAEEDYSPRPYADWWERIEGWRVRYASQGKPYDFMRKLSALLPDDACIVSDTGCVLAWAMQGFQFKQGQRFVHAMNQTPMGYGLPAAVGAAFATGKPVILLTGDGGLAVNITDMATIAHHRLPIKVILFNNRGHAMCRQTQRQWLDSRYCATGPTDVATPDYGAVASAYGFAAYKTLGAMLSDPGPAFTEVAIDPEEGVAPQARFGYPIHDQEPALPRAELEEIMCQ